MGLGMNVIGKGQGIAIFPGSKWQQAWNLGAPGQHLPNLRTETLAFAVLLFHNWQATLQEPYSTGKFLMFIEVLAGFTGLIPLYQEKNSLIIGCVAVIREFFLKTREISFIKEFFLLISC